MGIKCTTTSASIDKFLEDNLRRIRQAQINCLKHMGEAAVTEARENHRYRDQTGNLQSSIGYCIAEDGKIVFGGADTFKVVKDGQEGTKEGMNYLQSLVSEHSTGLVLIIVAGMNYAAYVEAKNLNVLDSAEQLVERELPVLLKQLKID
jgi:hypothetical protein